MLALKSWKVRGIQFYSVCNLQWNILWANYYPIITNFLLAVVVDNLNSAQIIRIQSSIYQIILFNMLCLYYLDTHHLNYIVKKQQYFLPEFGWSWCTMDIFSQFVWKGPRGGLQQMNLSTLVIAAAVTLMSTLRPCLINGNQQRQWRLRGTAMKKSLEFKKFYHFLFQTSREISLMTNWKGWKSLDEYFNTYHLTQGSPPHKTG